MAIRAEAEDDSAGNNLFLNNLFLILVMHIQLCLELCKGNLIHRLCLHLVAATRKSKKVNVATCLASALQGLFFWLGPFVVSLHYLPLFSKDLQERRGGLIGKHSPSGKLPLTWLCVFHRNCRAPSLQLEILAENSKPACSC